MRARTWPYLALQRRAPSDTIGTTKLSLNPVPHHSTFSVNRHGRFRESAAFRLVFESVVATCMKVGLVGGEGFAVDASVVEADASRCQRVEGSEVDWSDEQKAQRPVREYLAALESENSPINPGQAPKAMSPSDPAAAWTTRGRHKVQFAYSVNHLVDLLNGVIVDVEATPTRISIEVDVVETMLDRVEARFDLKPERITADVAYGTGDLLGEIVARNIAPHIPVWDKGKRDNGTLSREDFRFEPDRDLYICPRGNALKTTGKVHDGRTLLYRARKHDCDPCPLKLRCCPRPLGPFRAVFPALGSKRTLAQLAAIEGTHQDFPAQTGRSRWLTRTSSPRCVPSAPSWRERYRRLKGSLPSCGSIWSTWTPHCVCSTRRPILRQSPSDGPTGVGAGSAMVSCRAASWPRCIRLSPL